MKIAVTTLAFCVAALLALGLVMLYSSSNATVGAKYLQMQLIWCVIGFAFCVSATALDYRLLKRSAWIPFCQLPNGTTPSWRGCLWGTIPGKSQ